MNICAAGHTEHKKRRARVGINGVTLLLNVYDYKFYEGFAGYCTGQDDISRTILGGQVWELPESRLFIDLIRDGDRNNLVIDFGTHIGWYSLIAAKLGYQVMGFEGDAENAQTLVDNAVLNGVGDKIDVAVTWVDENLPTPEPVRVEMLKCDVEGNERYAVAMFASHFKQGLIRYALLEMSPTFNNSYPEIHKFLSNCGYRAYDAATRKPFDGNFNFNQANFLYTKETLQ